MIASSSPHPVSPRANVTLEQTLAQVKATTSGLSSAEAARRLAIYGPNRLRDEEGNHPLTIALRQFRSPLVLILLGAAALSFLLRETDEAIIVVLIVLASSGLGFYQEYQAGNAVAELRRRIAISSDVLRDGNVQAVPAATIVPGDVVVLEAGSLVAAVVGAVEPVGQRGAAVERGPVRGADHAAVSIGTA